MTSDHRAFRPRRARFVAVVTALVVIVFFTVLALRIERGGVTGWNELDSGLMIAFGVVVGLCVLRFAFVRAVPTAQGLTVHNLVRRRFVPWEEIVSVQFGGGAPWLILDLADTRQLAVMGVQHADGAYAEREAVRLATLVEEHTAFERDD